MSTTPANICSLPLHGANCCQVPVLYSRLERQYMQYCSLRLSINTAPVPLLKRKCASLNRCGDEQPAVLVFQGAFLTQGFKAPSL